MRKIILILALFAISFSSEAQVMKMFRQMKSIDMDAFSFKIMCKMDNVFIDADDKGIAVGVKDDPYHGNIYFEDSYKNYQFNGKPNPQLRILCRGRLTLIGGVLKFHYNKEGDPPLMTWGFEPSGDGAFIFIQCMEKSRYLTLVKASDGKYKLVLTSKKPDASNSSQKWKLYRTK